MKFVIALLLCCMCLCVVNASATDLNLHEYDANSIIPVSGNKILAFRQTDEIERISVYQNSLPILITDLPVGDEKKIPFSMNDGRMGFIDVDLQTMSFSFFYYREDGSMSTKVLLGERLFNIGCSGNGFYGLQIIDKGFDLIIFSDEGVEAFRQKFSKCESAVVGNCMALDDGTYLVSLRIADQNWEERVVVERLDSKGNIIWQMNLPGQIDYSNIVLASNEAGGVYLAAHPDTNGEEVQIYKEVRIWYIGIDGSIEWERRFFVDGLIVHPRNGYYDLEQHAFLLYMTGVAKSKGIYDVISISIDENGEMKNITSRDFSIRADYNFGIKKSPDHKFYAFSNIIDLEAEKKPLVLMPVEALPSSTIPVFSFN